MKEKISEKQIRWIDRSIRDDFVLLVAQYKLAFGLYFSRINDRKRVSGVGLASPFISILLHVMMLGTVMGLVFNEPIVNFIPFFGVSFCIWQSISAAISEAAVANERASSYIGFPYISGLLVYFINIIDFMANLFLRILAVVLIVCFVNVDVVLEANYIYLVFGLMLLCAVALVWSVPVSFFFDRFRIMRSFLPQFLFAIYLITPILWAPERISNYSWVYEYNPLYHLIEIVRAPILRGEFPAFSWMVISAVFLIGAFFSMALYSKNKKLIVYGWVA